MTHIAARDSITLLTVYAARTERVRLGTGVIPIYARTPANMAQSFATLDEFSGGRTVAGLGVLAQAGGRGLVRPVDRQTARGDAGVRGDHAGHPAGRGPAAGREVPHRLPPHGMRSAAAGHADLPGRPLAGDAPAAGEIADGVVLWLCNPNYIRDVVVPSVREGAEKAGQRARRLRHRGRRAVRRDRRPRARRASASARRSPPYFELPYYRAMLERSGLDPDDGARPTISSACWQRVGPPEEAIGRCAATRDCGATSPCVGGISGTDFDATLEALAQEPRLASARPGGGAGACRSGAPGPRLVVRPSPRPCSPPRRCRNLDRGRFTPSAAGRSCFAHSAPPARFRAAGGEEPVADWSRSPCLATARSSRSTVAAISLRPPDTGFGSLSPPIEQPEGRGGTLAAIMETWRDPHRSPWARSRAGCGATAAGRRTSRCSFITRAS